MQTLDLIPDIEFDIEEELNTSDHMHAITGCGLHYNLLPENGTIVKVLCGRLIRYVKGRDSNKEKCPSCLEKFGNNNEPCWKCGK